MTLRLLAVHAHPDDESSKGAGTSAYYRSRGARVMVVSCTGGEAGSILNENLVGRAAAERDMGGFRRGEMANAAAIMDIEHRWLGYTDSGMPPEGEPFAPDAFSQIPLELSAEPLVRIIREFRPQVMVTYDENGGYPHADHIRTHEISLFARDAAADPDRYPDAGPAWQVQKTYYERIFNGPRMNALYSALVAEHPDSPIIAELDEMKRWFDRPDLATSHVDVSDFFDVRDAALKAHASQVAPDSSFFFWPNELQAKHWPTEDYQLVESLVDSEVPESDLFAGIVDDEPNHEPDNDTTNETTDETTDR